MIQRSSILFLIGLPASGKSTIAPLLAQKLGWDWKDTDACVEVWWQINYGNFITCRELYKKIGEGGFRDVERRAVRQLDLEKPTVVATGGGTLADRDNAHLFKSKGMLIYLKQRLEEMEARLSPEYAVPRERVKARLPIFEEFADVTIDIEDLTPAQIVALILEAYGKQ